MAIIQEELDGQYLKAAFVQAKAYIEEHVGELNALNVYPVPDGDTGINMLCTMRSAVEALDGVTSKSASIVSAKAARGALLGARGNSGVILSQILMGIAKGMEKKDSFSTMDFADSLRIATEMAYKTVTNPVEGTILTVINEVAKVASQVADRGLSFGRIVAAIIIRAEKTVEKTPEMLPVLKEAGVVDAGAKGLLYVLHGMRCFSGNESNKNQEIDISRQSDLASPESGYGFDVQFLIGGSNMPLNEIRHHITGMGESVLVVGDENLIRVHIHTQQPDKVLEYARAYGKLEDIIVDNMDEQVNKRRTMNREN